MAGAGPVEDVSHAGMSPAATILAVLDEVADLLPQQAPLSFFVHHNTLHAFEDLPFRNGVLGASDLFGTRPFQSEQAFGEHLRTGRIAAGDVRAVLAEADVIDGDVEVVPGGPTWAEFRFRRLTTVFEIPRGAGLRWLLEEEDARHRFHPLVGQDRRDRLRDEAARRYAGLSTVGGRDAGERRGGRDRLARRGARGQAVSLEARLLGELWRALENQCPPAPPPAAPARRRDQILRRLDVDTDDLVHPPLIRLCAAFLDQGVAHWPMPGRADGLLGVFRRLFGLSDGPLDVAWRGLAEHLRTQVREGWSAEDTVVWALRELGLPEAAWPAAIQASLLSLRGWAGMVRQVELRPDQVPAHPVPGRLVDFLAVQLVLEVFATRHVLTSRLGPEVSPRELGPFGRSEPEPALALRAAGGAIDTPLVYEAFVLAQLMDAAIGPLLEPSAAGSWMDAVAGFDDRERRWLLHLAYERNYRTAVLDALYAYSRRDEPAPAPPPSPGPGVPLHAVFCMDEREESLRRHLEECYPDVRTYGAAGFFGVAMAYQGLDDARPRPLCPVTLTPTHLVVERAEDYAAHDAYRRARRRYGRVGHNLATARGTLGRGAALTMAAGLASVVPLAGRCLFPRAAEHWAGRLHHRAGVRPRTRLVIERARDEPAEGTTLPVGFTVAEMADIVETMLVTIGLTAEPPPTTTAAAAGGAGADPDPGPGPDPGPLVLVIGHGSSSLNNPHEAAHDCGATGGGRGGPNARAFAAMANHPRVREELTRRGQRLHPDTWFVGAYHNTCDESVDFYDTDLLPAGARPALRRAESALAEAVRLNAHERARRFASAPPDLDPDQALAHVQSHARDLGQPRPEYGHATNAVCLIGRRSRTRGLYLDRRAFLVSYDPDRDPDGEVLTRLLLSVGPVGAGINLEYYFSVVDPAGYGCGTKLPHNITALVGVMDGYSSDLRTGLPWQMVEIHEPMRLLVIVEAEPATLTRILREQPGLDRLVSGGWIQLVAWNPRGPDSYLYVDGTFRPHEPEDPRLPVVARSADVYAGRRDHLAFAEVAGMAAADLHGPAAHDPHAELTSTVPAGHVG